MRDKTHIGQVEKWAKFVRDNPDSWKKEHTEFINSQIIKSWNFYNRLLATPNGMAKIEKLRKLKG